MSKKKKGEEEEIKIDLGFGKLSFGGLFKGLGNLIDLMAQVAEEGKEIKREGQFGGATKSGKEVRGVYGFSIRTLGGEPVVETFGNIRRTPKGPVVEEVREPLVDIFDEGKEIRIICELPGVKEEEINLELKGDILTIRAEGEERKYLKEVLLPSPVKKESQRFTYKNGILEIRFVKS